MDTVKRKEAMIEQMSSTLGNIALSCKNVHISRQTHYSWLEKDPKYALEISNVEEASIDFAESKLKQQIDTGNTSATIFYLKTKGKKRGYIESQQFDHTSNGQSMAGSVVVSEESAKNIRKMLEEDC